MRIRVGIADLLTGPPGITASGLVIIRTEGDLIFISPATLHGPRLTPVSRGRTLPGGMPAPMRRAGPSPGLGTVHSDWITLTMDQSRALSELRGRSVTVEFRRVTASSGTGSPAQVKVRVNDAPARFPAVGTTGIAVVQVVPVQGDFDSPLEAHADHFIRTDPTLGNIPGGEAARDLYRMIASQVDLVRGVVERLSR